MSYTQFFYYSLKLHIVAYKISNHCKKKVKNVIYTTPICIYMHEMGLAIQEVFLHLSAFVNLAEVLYA